MPPLQVRAYNIITNRSTFDDTDEHAMRHGYAFSFARRAAPSPRCRCFDDARHAAADIFCYRAAAMMAPPVPAMLRYYCFHAAIDVRLPLRCHDFLRFRGYAAT